DDRWNWCGASRCHSRSDARDRGARTARLRGDHANRIDENHKKRNSFAQPCRGGGEIASHLPARKTERGCGMPRFCGWRDSTLYRSFGESADELLNQWERRVSSQRNLGGPKLSKKCGGRNGRAAPLYVTAKATLENTLV